MGRLYSSISTIKRLFRSINSVRESIIRFSTAYKDLGADTGNSGSISLSGITFDLDYCGHETFTFEFTSSTSFRVSSNIVGLLGTGSRSSVFTLTDMFLVPIANWSGTAVIGDKIYITANSDISDNGCLDFIQDATMYINSELERAFGTLANVTFYDDESVDVPEAISYACSRLSAYELYIAIFPAGEIKADSAIYKWKSLAEKSLASYIRSHGKGPIWRSREQLITEVGVTGIGEGVVEINNLPDPKNMEYLR
jgi:hypothetical protein